MTIIQYTRSQSKLLLYNLSLKDGSIIVVKYRPDFFGDKWHVWMKHTKAQKIRLFELCKDLCITRP